MEPSVPCPQCDKRYKRKGELKIHLIEVHNVERSQLATFGLGIIFFTSSIHGIVIKRIQNTNIEPVVRQEKQFKCDRCGSSYTRKIDLKRHMDEKC